MSTQRLSLIEAGNNASMMHVTSIAEIIVTIHASCLLAPKVNTKFDRRKNFVMICQILRKIELGNPINDNFRMALSLGS